MDDHHPAGIFYPGRPTIFHGAPSPYGIPYRCLYSRNIDNLLFAGRNISVTHAVLSSTRVMGTCAVLGQAAGTAAALCARHACAPRDLSTGGRLKELQHTLMEDDCWLPGRSRPLSALAAKADLNGEGENVAALRDGLERNREGESHAWTAPLGSAAEYRWSSAVTLAGARLVFDSNLSHEKRMPCTYPQKGDVIRVPGTLVRQFRLEALDAAGQWRTVYRETDNTQRLVYAPFAVSTTALRLIPEGTWGDEVARTFAFEPLEQCHDKRPAMPDGPHFSSVRARISPEDLAPPKAGEPSTSKGHSA